MPVPMQSAARKKDIGELLKEYYRLLKEWERRLSIANDPKEESIAKNEIARIRELIRDLEAERDKAKTRRKNIAIIVTVIVIGIIGVWAYLTFTSVDPNYAAYREYMSKGDSLARESKIPEARKAFARAARYNPGDTSVGRKLALLDSADQYIRNNKLKEAGALVKVLISIPPASGLSATALSRAGVQSNPQLQITIAWNGTTLEIRISGGVPYKDDTQPYLVEGINCQECIRWTKVKVGFLASITATKVQANKIRLKDRLGQFYDGQIPPAPTGPDLLNNKGDTPIVKPQSDQSVSDKQAAFNRYVQAGDSLFTAKQYMDARNAYLSAKTIRPADAALTKKIEDCDREIGAALKNIPRVNIPGGSFTMGTDNGNRDEGPAHPVSLSGFKMSRTEVTVKQYRDFCKYTGRPMPQEPTYGWADDQPVVNVSWHDAAAYCEWVGGRLPTEAEWEYAALGGAATTYSGSNRVDNVAIYNANSRGKVGKVAKKAANDYGLYDMTGNVTEWCADWYGDTYYGQKVAGNPKGPSAGIDKVIRGGAYNSSISTQDGNQLRITYRNSDAPAVRQPYIGFRVAWDQ